MPSLRTYPIHRSLLGIMLAVSCGTPYLIGQAPSTPATGAPVTNPTRFVGTVTAASAGVLSIKTDAGTERKVTVPDGIKIQRIAPGEKDLSKAAVIQFSDLATGDRVLVKIAPEPTTDPVTAISIIAIPQADLAQKQQQEQADWQRRGVGGLVKSVDPGTGIVVITSGAGATQKTTTLHISPATILRRYAPDSVSFDKAKTAPIEVIHVGDQLRARGTKNADGTDVAAEEIVSGSFRNISGTIIAVNQGAMTLSLKDLATKQTVTVHVGPDAQMRKLPEMMAKRLANITKPGEGASTAGKAGAAGSPAGGGQGTQQSPQGAQPGATQASGENGRSARAGGGDMQQMLNRAPAIHLADLQKGDAVMLVSTEGTGDVTAITLLAGVEPLLEAPASTQNMLLSNWSMSSGGAESAQ
ncbi:hypothetical protein [Acidicapsa ligni]|nr:hypothetical protein [Acidicapsa ligni]